MQNDLKVGDVVVLKSGGPKMTVDTLQNTRKNLVCCWMENGQIQYAEFKPDMLK